MSTQFNSLNDQKRQLCETVRKPALHWTQSSSTTQQQPVYVCVCPYVHTQLLKIHHRMSLLHALPWPCCQHRKAPHFMSPQHLLHVAGWPLLVPATQTHTHTHLQNSHSSLLVWTVTFFKTLWGMFPGPFFHHPHLTRLACVLTLSALS